MPKVLMRVKPMQACAVGFVPLEDHTDSDTRNVGKVQRVTGGHCQRP